MLDRLHELRNAPRSRPRFPETEDILAGATVRPWPKLITTAPEIRKAVRKIAPAPREIKFLAEPSAAQIEVAALMLLDAQDGKIAGGLEVTLGADIDDHQRVVDAISWRADKIREARGVRGVPIFIPDDVLRGSEPRERF